MRKFLCGMVIGAVSGGIVPVIAAELVGKQDYLLGWTVIKDGNEICFSPFVWTSTKEIECD